ncbi:MAG: hypothetical protein IT423_06835 [Pirellulaceae bacterium]|nr:hypothetical protein [Pirellulaceae bacterium]
MQVFVHWTTLLVPALAIWAIVGINAYRSSALRPVVDTLYFLVMILIGVLTWRTMSNNDAFWLIHTASLGIMIVFGVLPRRESLDEAVYWVS